MDDPTVHTPALAANELRALSWLGLALRAGRIRVGSDAVFSAIRSGQAKLVVLAGDAGSNLAKKVADKCAFYQVPLRKGPDKSVLGQALGRRTVGVVAVLDAEFAERFRQSVGAIYGGEAFDETEGL